MSNSNLPAVVTRYLAAHNARDLDPAMACYTEDAVAVDDGHTYRGPAEIRAWLARATAVKYTTTLLSTHRVDDEHHVAVQHLEGDFPGGVVDLRFQFTLRGDRIAELVIEP
ncbi:nuclear transport factor 2 family protein [Kutzneria chonburiensis]|uniref:Nuclear transport factor 2 family protein n=1 Tax=Kutzneria chonburiensis TaxID=1483604 RepID=A0ABV6MS15_9PSEU|nr:nuclear transport factor 2 family protein [Kutzneria chonburiensis]